MKAYVKRNKNDAADAAAARYSLRLLSPFLRHAREPATKDDEWVCAMLVRKPAKLVAIALANRTARIIWAVMAREDAYESIINASLATSRSQSRKLSALRLNPPLLGPTSRSRWIVLP